MKVVLAVVVVALAAVALLSVRSEREMAARLDRLSTAMESLAARPAAAPSATHEVRWMRAELPAAPSVVAGTVPGTASSTVEPTAAQLEAREEGHQLLERILATGRLRSEDALTLRQALADDPGALAEARSQVAVAINHGKLTIDRHTLLP